MNSCPCPHHEPWRTKSDLHISQECFHFIYYSERCDCAPAPTYNQPCPWQGYPNGELAACLQALSTSP